MKESEKLILSSQQEDNDTKSFALQYKALRENRSERFVEDWLPLLSKRYNVVENNHKYTITTQDYGIIDYFPKINKILIRKDNNCIKPGFKWIIANLTK